MSRTLLHDWECSIEKNKNNTEELLKIAEDIYNTAYARGKASEERPQGEWVDYSNEGYVECPFCGSATNCEDNKDELHYCWNCGAEMKGGADMRKPNCVRCDHFGDCEGCEKGEEE